MAEYIERLIINNDIPQDKIEELNNLLVQVKEKRLNITKTDIFLDTVLESSIPSYGIEEILGTKINDLILRGELTNVLQVDDDHLTSGMSLLDLNEFNSIELTFDEQKQLKIALEQCIKEKHDAFLSDIEVLTDLESNSLENIINRIKFETEAEKEKLISWQKQLTEIQKLYVNNLFILGTKVQELLDLKIDLVPKMAEEKSNEIQIETEKFMMRLQLMEHQLHVSIFKELPISMDAYRKAILDLKSQQNECNKEIEILKCNLDNYKILSKNQEYQEILKDFKQYTKSLEKKLWIYNELSKNTP